MANALYTQCPLPSSPGHIRLIRLHPSSDASAPLRGTIFATTFEASRGSYEALSYCWGDDARPETITLILETKETRPSQLNPDERTAAIQFPVTRSLAEALTDLRLPWSDRLLWADALCIDQAHNGEKSIQVRQMYDVYASSRRTVVYLGRGGGEGMQAAVAHRDYLRAVNMKNQQGVASPHAEDTGTIVTWDPALGIVRAGEGAPARVADEADCLQYSTTATLPDATSHGVLFAHNPDIADSWACVLGRQWTTRAWTTQEFVAGPDVLMQLGAGEVTLTLDDLWNFVRYCEWDSLGSWTQYDHTKYQRVGCGLRLQQLLFSDRAVASKVFHMMNIRWRRDLDMGVILSYIRGNGLVTVLDTKDARDVLWSLLALSSDRLVQGLEPNYELGIDEVYRRFSIRMATEGAGGAQAFLRLPLQMGTAKPSWRLAEGLRTSTAGRLYHEQRYDNSLKGWARASKQGKELTVPGVLVDRIDHLTSPLPDRCQRSDGNVGNFLPDPLRFMDLLLRKLDEAASWPHLFVLPDESPAEAMFKFSRGLTPFAPPADEMDVPVPAFNLQWEEYFRCWHDTTLALLNHYGFSRAVSEQDEVLYGSSTRRFKDLPFFDKVRNEGWPVDMIRSLAGDDVVSRPRCGPEDSDLATSGRCLEAWDKFRETALRYSFDMATCWAGKSVGMSSRGHLCNLDKEARVGDWLAMLGGCDHAVILRRQPGGAFSIVGRAYAHGLLEGMEMYGDVEQEIRLC